MSSKKITLIMPTFNNHALIRRQLIYYSEFDANLVIADGSLRAMNIHPSGKFNKLNWFYFNIPGADSIYDRLISSLHFVSTEFFCLLDDGDFILSSGISSAISEMNRDPTMLCNAGRVGLFQSHVTNKLGQAFSVFSNWEHWSRSFDTSQDGSVAQTLFRLVDEVRTANCYYMVFRTTNFLSAFGKMAQLKPSSPDAGELIWSGIVAGSCSIKLGNFPFWIRGTTPSVPHEIYAGRIRRHEWTQERYNEEISAAASLVSREIQSVSGRSIGPETITSYFDRHLKFYRELAFNPKPQEDKIATTGLLKTWSLILERDLTVDEFNDLSRLEAIIKVFPRGVPFEISV